VVKALEQAARDVEKVKKSSPARGKRRGK